MAHEQGRLAQIFIWKQAGAADLDYARRVLSVVNPDASRLIASGQLPLKLFSIVGPWPDDFWERALSDMLASPAPDGTLWSDTTRYDLAGWQGRDNSTGDHLFVVTVYRKTNPPAADSFQGAPAPTPSLTPWTPVPQVPYNPQRPTGPIQWPPEETREGANTQHGRQSGALDSAAHPYFDQAQGHRLETGPLGNMPLSEPSPESYVPYYVGIPPRLFAGIVDLASVAFVEVGALFLYLWWTGEPAPRNVGEWVGMYWGFFCLGIVIFALYHVVQWSIWGQTLGKSLMGIKVVGRNGKKPDPGRALLRLMAYFPVGFLQIAYDPWRQAVHDKIAETYVVPESPPTPVPAGLPGYSSAVPEGPPGSSAVAAGSGIAPAIGLADVAGSRSYGMVQFAPEQHGTTGSLKHEDETSVFREIASLDESMESGVDLPEMLDRTPAGMQGQFATGTLTTGPLTASMLAPTSNLNLPMSHTTGALNEQMLRQRTDRTAGAERARELFRQGMQQMEQGVQQTEQGYKVEASAAQRGAMNFHSAAELVPNSVVYRYFLGVALRYSDGFEVALPQFRRVLELDPSHYEARQQVAYGSRWHDAFAYLPWTDRPNIRLGTPVPESLMAFLPPNNQPMTRLVLLREGNNKVAAVLSRTPRNSWAKTLSSELPAHIDLLLSRTPSGPIIAFYVVVEDKQGDPYKGETFLNPHDPGNPSYDACQLGQNLLSQIHRQDHAYLIFVDEENRLLLSRRLDFDPQTQVNINRCLYEVQTLPAQIMDPERFQSAAEWHMEHFSLDQIK